MIGLTFKEHLKFDDANILVGFKSRIDQVKLDGYVTDGTQMLKDLRMLEKQYGLDETYSFERRFIEMEYYSIYLEE